MSLYIGIIMSSLAGTTLATVDVDDIDTYLMQDMDDAIKDLEPVLGAANVESALADAAVLREGLQWIERYFLAKGGAEEEVEIARDGAELVARVIASIDQGDFATAIEGARATEQNCQRCHDLYERQR